MARIGIMLVVAGLVLGLVGARRVGASVDDVDRATFVARLTDSKGVRFDLADLGYSTGANVLTAFRGDAEVEIPFRLIRVLELGDLVAEQGRAPCRATLTSGKLVDVEIDSTEGTRMLRAKAEYGEFRIRMGNVRRLELIAPSGT